MSTKHESQEDVERRIRFYTSDEARSYLKKHGVPKSGREMRELIATTYPNADPNTAESVSRVYFQVHPQQINIRDKANGKLIVTIEK